MMIILTDINFIIQSYLLGLGQTPGYCFSKQSSEQLYFNTVAQVLLNLLQIYFVVEIMPLSWLGRLFTGNYVLSDNMKCLQYCSVIVIIIIIV